MSLHINDIDFDLPAEFIAQYPAEPRDSSKLLVYQEGNIYDEVFYDLYKYIDKDTLMVFNDTKVFKARIYAKTPYNGKVEFLLLKCLNQGENIWKVICRPKEKFIKQGKLKLGGFEVIFLEELDEYELKVKFSIPFTQFTKYLNDQGEVPIPPYVDNQNITIHQYQTMFALNTGSAAAPTASLHFTPRVFEKLEEIEKMFITLHVGLGTFIPVKAENIKDHHMHKEEVLMSPMDFLQLLQAKAEGKNILGIGTTATRAIEGSYFFFKDFFESRGVVLDLEDIQKWCDDYYEEAHTQLSFETDIFILPGYDFKFTNQLITNFHTPKSTLLLLVAAFIQDKYSNIEGLTKVKEIYEYAKTNKYRFFSFGDAMFIK